MEFKEFLEKLKASNIDQKSREFTEDMPDDLLELWESFDPSLITYELDIEKHRWYELSTDVYEVDGKYFGVRGATQMYSESSNWSDLSVTWDVFEMKPVQITTYISM